MKNIMIIGAAIGDVLVYPASPEVFASGSHPAREILLSTGGDGLNEATVLAGLGKEPYLCTLLGRDQMGELVKTHCQTRGIRQDFLRCEEDIPTGLNVVLVRENGERSFLTNPSSTLRNLKPCHIPETFPGDVEILCLASIFVSPWLGSQELAEIFARAKKQGITVLRRYDQEKKRRNRLGYGGGFFSGGLPLCKPGRGTASYWKGRTGGNRRSISGMWGRMCGDQKRRKRLLHKE